MSSKDKILLQDKTVKHLRNVCSGLEKIKLVLDAIEEYFSTLNKIL